MSDKDLIEASRFEIRTVNPVLARAIREAKSDEEVSVSALISEPDKF